MKYGNWTLGQTEALLNILGGEDVARKILAGAAKVVVQIVDILLEFVGTAIVPAVTDKFVAKEKFVRDTSIKSRVKISYLGDNFVAWFLGGAGKIEDPISEQTLRYHKLRQASTDSPIIAELGGEKKSEITLSELFFLMEKQGNGEAGVLLTDGFANIFYIEDQNGALRAVYAYWRDGGWRVNANAVESPGGWREGHQVFSRNSIVLDPSATRSA